MIFKKLNNSDDLTLDNFNSRLAVDEEENHQYMTDEKIIKNEQSKKEENEEEEEMIFKKTWRSIPLDSRRC